MKKLSIDDKLALNIFHPNEEEPHIIADLSCTDMAEIKKLLLACPDSCYKYIDGTFSFDHVGCLECGTCRVLCGKTIVKEWNHPQGGEGVIFRQG